MSAFRAFTLSLVRWSKATQGIAILIPHWVRLSGRRSSLLRQVWMASLIRTRTVQVILVHHRFYHSCWKSINHILIMLNMVCLSFRYRLYSLSIPKQMCLAKPPVICLNLIHISIYRFSNYQGSSQQETVPGSCGDPWKVASSSSADQNRGHVEGSSPAECGLTLMD